VKLSLFQWDFFLFQICGRMNRITFMFYSFIALANLQKQVLSCLSVWCALHIRITVMYSVLTAYFSYGHNYDILKAWVLHVPCVFPVCFLTLALSPSQDRASPPLSPSVGSFVWGVSIPSLPQDHLEQVDYG
jgi:hypothetical protein